MTLGDNTLTQELEVVNQSPSDAVFKFTAALHTYFRVSDISQTSIIGLSGLKFLDNMSNRQQNTDEQQSISVDGEIDRIYVQAPNRIQVRHNKLGNRGEDMGNGKQGLLQVGIPRGWEGRIKE